MMQLATGAFNRHKVKLLFSVLWFLLLSLFIWCYIARRGTLAYLNSDTACEVMQFLSGREQGTIIPEDWLGGTMLHINAALLYPLSSVFGSDLIVCRNMMSMIMTMFLYASMVLFSKIVFQNNSWVLSIPLLFSTVFPQFTRLYIYYAEYTIGIILLLLFLCASALSEMSQNAACRKAFQLLSCCILFCACLIGAQGLQTITVPVVGSMILDSIFNKDSDNSNVRKTILRSSIFILTSVFGLLIYNLYIKDRCGILGLSKLFQFKSVGDLQNLGELFVQSGRYWLCDQRLDPEGGLRYVILVSRLFCTLALIFFLPILSYRKASKSIMYKESTLDYKLVSIHQIAFISFMQIVVIFFFSKSYTTGPQVRYFMNSFFILSCLGANYLYTYLVRNRSIRMIAILIPLSFILLVSGSNMYLGPRDTKLAYETIGKTATFLQENDLSFGYASYWNASVNTVISNDRCRILNLHLNGRNIEAQGWYTSKRWYDSSYYNGQSFLMLTKDEYNNKYWRDFAYSVCGCPQYELTYDGMYYLIYNYNIGCNLPQIQPYQY